MRVRKPKLDIDFYYYGKIEFIANNPYAVIRVIAVESMLNKGYVSIKELGSFGKPISYAFKDDEVLEISSIPN